MAIDDKFFRLSFFIGTMNAMSEGRSLETAASGLIGLLCLGVYLFPPLFVPHLLLPLQPEH
jgi:hypothetical protein